MSVTPQAQRSLLMLTLTAACLLASALLLPRLLTRAPAAASVVTAPGCNLSVAPCTSRGDGLAMTLTLASGPALSGEELEFSLQLQGTRAQSISLLLEGRDMYMGINRLQLTESADQSGLWRGRTTLAICTTAQMPWQARIEALGDTTPIIAHYEFSAQ
ncbi:hypothetical protein [Marinobacterium sedimentorum]|uniref:hypothetical protein n=1 Tax=Marinobacterium sedimentorum TaxID=2927804 RepID=UPI0020C661C7|nr:hypothetical protein [Marinobacterium sedimentorum]MCP8689918.1 hypothetical protein [Marinobacterium sedimentorum]